MKGTKILIVEDERIVAEDLKRFLMKTGYVVTGIAASGEEAIRNVELQRPDLVLMDIRIQGPQDGIEVAERLYAEYNLPVSFLTAYADSATLDRAKVTMPFGYILKPFETRSLQAVIELALHRHMMEKVVGEMDDWHARALRHLPGNLIATDRTGRILFLNKGAEKLSGWTPDALIGKPLSTLLSQEKGDSTTTREGDSCSERPGLLRTKAGIAVPVVFTKSPLPSEDGEPDGHLILVKS
ncbi:MAG: response regulator [Elusimicrobia bacterium]|nr:response regulator [Elusimicrobiota bacterium]